MTRLLLFWLPILTTALAALIMHAPMVDAWHDWTDGWARYQLVALGTWAGLAIGAWCVVMLVVWWVCNERPANRRQRNNVGGQQRTGSADHANATHTGA